MAGMDLDDDGGGGGGRHAAARRSLQHQGKQELRMPLHRVRFVDWAPSAVSALAFLPLAQQISAVSSTTRGLLAVGRDNGNIDVCVWVEDDAIEDEGAAKQRPVSALSSTVVAKGWMVDTTLVGSSPSKVDSLAFVLSPTSPYPTPRLFSTSGGAIVTEHFLPPHLLLFGGQGASTRFGQELPASLRKSSLLNGSSRSIASHGGSVWSMAASPLAKHLAIGCEDGVVRIIDIDEGRFELQSSTRASRREGDGTVRGTASNMDRAKTRIVSLAWGPPRRKENKQVKKVAASDSDDSDSDDDDEDWEDTFILGGTTQSYALVWSATTGRVLTKLLVDKARAEQTIVWSVVTLPNGTCVLGDSLGHVSFFDGRTYTLLPGGKFANHGKTADVLSLCVGTDGKSVYSASVDQNVVEYALIAGGNADARVPARWVSTGRRRLHAHDVRALAIDPPYEPRAASSKANANDRLPILVSGGMDFHLVLTPASSPSKTIVLEAPKKSKSGKRGDNDERKANAYKLKSAKFDHVNPISSTAITTFADTVHRRVPFVPSTGRGSLLGGGSVVRLCAERRWIVVRRERGVAIWKLPDSATNDEDDVDGRLSTDSQFAKVIEISAKAQSNLVCMEVSHDGRFLLMGDLYETKLFELHFDGDHVTPKRVRGFSEAFAGQGLPQCPGCSAATFTPDCTRVVVATQPAAFLHVVELPAKSNGPCTLLKTFGEHRLAMTGRAVAGKAVPARRRVKAMQNGNGKMLNGNAAGSTSSDEEGVVPSDETDEEDAVDASVGTARTTYSRIDAVQASPDGQYFVSIDTAKRIHCYSLDTLHHRGAMPSPAQQPTSVVFDPWRPSRMCCVLPTNQVVLYDLESRQIGDHAVTSSDASLVRCINERLSAVRDNAIGAVWLAPTVLVVWGATFMCTARQKANEDVGAALNGKQRKAKRAHPDDDAAVNGNGAAQPKDAKQKAAWYVKLMTKYQPLMHVGTLPVQGQAHGDARELIVVERPYYDVSRGLPPTWSGGAKYGM